MSAETAERLGVAPLAELVSYGMVAGPDPSLLTQPSRAIVRALEKIDKQVSDLDLFEINEAFAAVALASMSDLGIGADVVNVNGGAIALGHPIGVSGSACGPHLGRRAPPPRRRSRCRCRSAVAVVRARPPSCARCSAALVQQRIVGVDARPLRQAALGLVGIAAVRAFLGDSAGIPCPLRRLTGVPCPLCGMTRGVTEAVHGHLGHALQLNPGSVLLVVVAVALLTVWRRPTVWFPAWLPFVLVGALWAFQLTKYATGQPL